MPEQISDPLLHELVSEISTYDRERVSGMMDMFVAITEAAGAINGEILWALTGVLVAMIRSGQADKLDVLALVQRMITLRMTWGERLDSDARAADAH